MQFENQASDMLGGCKTVDSNIIQNYHHLSYLFLLAKRCRIVKRSSFSSKSIERICSLAKLCSISFRGLSAIANLISWFLASMEAAKS